MSNVALGGLLGSGQQAEVFEYGAMAAKLYKSTAPKRAAFNEAAKMAMVEALGLPVAAVQAVLRIGDRWGVVMARADGPHFADAVRQQRDHLPLYLEAMARLQFRVHSHKATYFPSLKARLAANIQQAKILGESRQSDLLSRLATMPDGDRLCHGDFHPLNILGPIGHETIIDWPDASCGDPAADVCRSYVLIKHPAPEIASAYVDAYASISAATRDTILNWLPFVAAARLAEGVPNETAGLIEMAGDP